VNPSYSVISAPDFRNHDQPDRSELQLQDTTGYGSRVQASPHSNHSTAPQCADRFSPNAVATGHAGRQGVERSRRDAATEPTTNTSWKELVSDDTLASILWGVTNRHVGFTSRDESVEKCLDEFRDKRKAIAPYLVSATVRENGYFLRDFIHKISKYSHVHSLPTVQHYYDQFREILNDHQLYHRAVKEVINNMNEDMKYAVICAQRRFCSCFSSQDIVRYEEQLLSLSQYDLLLRAYLVYGYYIDPIIRSIFIVTGLILNCTILFIFAKHKNTVTQCDVMVMNIAVTGILILIVYIPLQYIHFYHSSVIPHEEFSDNGLFTFVQSAVVSVAALSLLTLRVQYHIQMFHPLNRAVLCLSLRTMWQRPLSVLTVWMWALSVATLTYMFNDEPTIGFLFAPLVYMLLYAFILPATMRRFKIYSNKGIVPPEEEKIVTSTTVIQLSKLFWMTHVPLFVWLVLERLCGFVLKLASVNYSYVETAFCYLYFSYACVNILALYRSSGVFRKLLHTHVFRGSCKRNVQQEVMLEETGHSAQGTQSSSTRSSQ
jgi:hypothetical protein